jgi:hypothetical protein
MLLQTNSYIVPKDRRSEHTRLLRKFRTTLARLGADHFEVYEQVGANFATGEATGRFVQIMRFRDRQHQLEVQAAEKTDPDAQRLIQDFCALINFPYQQQQGLFAVGFYTSALPVISARSAPKPVAPAPVPPVDPSQPQPPIEEPLVPEAAQNDAGESTALPSDSSSSEQPEGSSLLDFAHLDPSASTEPPPLRLVTESDEIIESDIATPEEASPSAGLPAPLEKSDNGQHAKSFSDAPEAMLDLVGREGAADAEDVLSDTDREAILGELTGEDLEEEADARKQQADGR